MEYGSFATAQQMGEAAQLRDRASGKDRKALNFIVHSQDIDPEKYGTNKYACKEDIYDPEAQEVIDRERKRQ